MSTSDISINQKQFLGHPRGLFVLFFSEMWERFCYYGMRGLLTVYLIDVFLKGDAEAFAIYGTYTALVYMAPVLGGKIADNILGYRNAVILGGILMAIGEFMLLGKSDFWLYLGMAGIIIGNGYFKANISSIVGKLYKDGDPKKDSGFTIFYIGINVGALLATTVCVEIGRKVGYEYGFALAGAGMIIGTLIFVFGSKEYKHAALPPNPEKLKASVFGPINRFHLIILGSIALVPAVYLLIQFKELMPFLLVGVLGYLLWNLMTSAIQYDKETAEANNGVKIWTQRMIAMIIIFVFNVSFWACFEQAGTSLTLFARRNVDRMIGNWEMSDATTQFFNPFYIILFGSVFSIMWLKLQQRKMNPSIPLKFGLGIIQLGLGYLVIMLGGMFISEEYLVPLWTIGILYLLHTTGELFLSPIGLSMVTKLAPPRLTGTAMGGWFLSFAFSNYLAAVIAGATGVGHGGHEEAAASSSESFNNTTLLVANLDTNNVINNEKAKLSYFYDSSKNELYQEIELKGEKLEYFDRLSITNDLALSMKEKAKKFVAKTNEFSKIKIKEADSLNGLTKLPQEINTMSQAISPTIVSVHKEMYSFFKDTSSYKGKKILAFDLLLENYHNSLKGIDENITKTSSLIDSISNGVDYINIKNDFSAQIIGIGDNFSSINKKVIQRITMFNENYNFNGINIENAEKAIENFDSSYATVASHVYWETYLKAYTIMGLITIGIGLLLCFISKPLNKLMHGVE